MKKKREVWIIEYRIGENWVPYVVHCFQTRREAQEQAQKITNRTGWTHELRTVIYSSHVGKLEARERKEAK